MSMKNSSDTIENRTRDLPACSAVPQPTSPPSAHHYTARLTKDGSLYDADTHTSKWSINQVVICTEIRSKTSFQQHEGPPQNK
jgi:hypothetical protein